MTNLSPVTNGSLNAVSCKGSGSTAVCVAVGGYILNSDQKPLLLQTVNGGSTWTNNSPSTGVAVTGVLNSVTCSGQSTTTQNNTVCLAIGNVRSSTNVPMFLYNTNIGFSSQTSWSTNTISGTVFNALSAVCTGNSSSAICTAVGVTSSTYDPSNPSVYSRSFKKLTYTIANGWSTSNVTTSTPGALLSVSCPATTGNACLAAGYGVNGSNMIPNNYVSLDGGGTWTFVPSGNFSPTGAFYGTASGIN